MTIPETASNEVPRVAALVGPTAVGKSAVALEVAPHLGAEIVSIDSMQIYKAMDIGTAKPSIEERNSVPHHLLDMWPADYEVTVAEFQSVARRAIEEISSRGRVPLLVGGSGLYFRAVVDDLRFPPRSIEVRRDLEREAEDVGAEALHARLEKVDPVAAGRIEPTNARRIVRALEAIELTGRPFSENDSWDRYESRYRLAAAGLALERSALYRRISERVDEMFRRGLEREVRDLERNGLGVTARQALGYRQILEAGEDVSRSTLLDEVVKATKRFARRQESWFRTDPRIRWFDAADRDVEDKVMEYLRDSLALDQGG
ncbi:MAG: tRNA (adenosine(37)-N6)-dimethylallyltransferase MiaA [Actinomycetota bacterium]|nr:tRNA (adenosine(37)-N6)-dimethylallyltransferase MiaA [Actinomycetota bacterium]